MLFTSMEFLLIFLPVVIGVNVLLPRRAHNYWLLLCSLFFYAWGGHWFVLVMLGSILFNYLMALGIHAARSSGANGKLWLKRLLLGITVLGNLSVLFVYKYMNFTTGILASLFPGAGIPITEFVLPIGISFFTFQALSYVIDVYRGTPVQRNPAKLGLYISLFPQLVAGPIVRYDTIAEQIDQRRITFPMLSDGVYRFLLGFNKKMLLANAFAVAADAAWMQTDRSTAMAWLGAAAYTFQIFFDFSGYSDMAIGLGQMLGFRFLENFNYPYIASTISEFWRRWHISMGTWFRDYVYFPLGGSRVNSRGRLILNLLVVWLATGIWHGANWTFILWGLFYGILIIFEKLCSIEKRMENWSRTGRVLYRIATLLAVVMGWVLFRSESLGEAGVYLMDMFGMGGTPLADGTSLFYFREYFIMLIAGVVCSMPTAKFIRGKLKPGMQKVWDCCACAGQMLLFMVSISALIMEAHNPFIYFNF